MEQEPKTGGIPKLSALCQVADASSLDEMTAIRKPGRFCTYLEGVFPEPNLRWAATRKEKKP